MLYKHALFWVQMCDLASEWLLSERPVDKQICYSKLAENDGSHSGEACSDYVC